MDEAFGRLVDVDPELSSLLAKERDRQATELQMIAAENYVFAPVMEAAGSWLANKSAEGVPGARYHGGAQYLDAIESLAQRRALALFPGSEHVNVQPHSGASMNMAVYLATMRPGDRVVGMSLAHGGHLTHGSKANFSGKIYDARTYAVDPVNELIDYDEVERLALEVEPKVLVAGGSSYPRLIDYVRMAEIARMVGALFLVDMSHVGGLVAAEVIPSPFGHADFVTTTMNKTLRGPHGGLLFSRYEVPAHVDRTRFPAVRGTLSQAVDKAVFPGIQGAPLTNMIAAKAAALSLATTERFRSDMRRTVENARVLAAEFTAGGARIVSGGTDNHMVLIDCRPFGLTGARADAVLESVGMTVNKNAIPFDPMPPDVASGIRVGTPAATTRGLGPDDMREVAGLMLRVLWSPEDAEVQREVRAGVQELCRRFPVPGLPVAAMAATN